MTELFLAWRDPGRRWWPIGRLVSRDARFEFTYTRGAESAAAAGFRPLPGFPDLDAEYASKELFPLFANRVPRKSRADYPDFINWLDLSPGEDDPLVLLARSGGQRETDMFEVFPPPRHTRSGHYEAAFFVHGLRHHGPPAEDEARRLVAGEPLRLEPQPTNPEDPRAVRVLSVLRGSTQLGFVPRYICEDVHALLDEDAPDLQATVRRVNLPPTPAQFRVLCSLRARWPAGFRPLSNPDFERIHAGAGVARTA